MTPLYVNPLPASFELDFWGVNSKTVSIESFAGIGPVKTTLTQLDGPLDAFDITESQGSPSDPNSGGENVLFTFKSGDNGIIPGTYNFEARVSDGINADVVVNFQVHQQGISDLWGGKSIQGEDSNYGNGFGIIESDDASQGNDKTYRRDGLDISVSADGSARYVSYIVAGERTSYTAWTPSGEYALRALVSTNQDTATSFDVYVDGKYQDTGTIQRRQLSGPSNWEDFQEVDLNVKLNGYYETIEFHFTDGWINLDSFSLVERKTPSSGDIVSAINAGGGAIFQDGILYEADPLTGLGNVWTDQDVSDKNGIQAGFAGTLYETERWGPSLDYSVDTIIGEYNQEYTYNVQIHFAEIYWSNPGERVFDIEIEGLKVLENFDIMADAGLGTAKVIEFNGLDPTSFGDPDKLEIVLSSEGLGGIDNAKLSAIVVSIDDVVNPLSS
jgi:hypothetical protein